MFDHLIADNKLKEHMEDNHLGEEDEKFIKALIQGLKTGKVAVSY